MIKQIDYLKFIADVNYDVFLRQGYATAGHNGPHGHEDTPVRNTAHYLIIYGFLFKIEKDKRYLDICHKFANYLYMMQSKSKSGAIECMLTNKFDHLNGLIGQAWVIESLIYYYEITKSSIAIDTAYKIFCSQKYDKEKHLWRRIELDGTDIGYDPTYNHQVWFAACSYKLAIYCNDPEINNIIEDFINEGSKRDFVIYKDGLLHHHINIPRSFFSISNFKKIIKRIATPISFINSRKLNPKYMEYAYHIFDMYGFCILYEKYKSLPLFSSEKYKKAFNYAMDLENMHNKCEVYSYMNSGTPFNIYSYSYNSPAFEFPYISLFNEEFNENVISHLYDIQESLMFDSKSGMMKKNQPDIETWNARTYEIVRFYELKNNLK